jgi:hypothetical protein
VADEKQQFLLNIRGGDPLLTSPVYSNFLSVSRVGTDVQFEFVFVDLNQMAQLADKLKKSGSNEPQELAGRTVAKIVMPGLNFYQVKDHLKTVFDALAVELMIVETENEHDALASKSSGIR